MTRINITTKKQHIHFINFDQCPMLSISEWVDNNEEELIESHFYKYIQKITSCMRAHTSCFVGCWTKSLGSGQPSKVMGSTTTFRLLTPMPEVSSFLGPEQPRSRGKT
ncbi:unnamed protein product [Ilex paraguariensis]|uniref:Uncharacterized protein n=1 Tax=Ilex paraguariensis TaxID=185542 RepID=A0ABC8TFL4_9AQUA